MFVDIEITQLAQLITRASWAKGNITSGAHSDRGIKRLPSSLIRKTKQTRKTLERRSVSSSKAFSNLYKGFKSQTITPKRAIQSTEESRVHSTEQKVYDSNDKIKESKKKVVEKLSHRSIVTLIKEESDQKTTGRYASQKQKMIKVPSVEDVEDDTPLLRQPSNLLGQETPSELYESSNNSVIKEM